MHFAMAATPSFCILQTIPAVPEAQLTVFYGLLVKRGLPARMAYILPKETAHSVFGCQKSQAVLDFETFNADGLGQQQQKFFTP